MLREADAAKFGVGLGQHLDPQKTIALRRPAGTHGTYCAIALVMLSGLPLEFLISFAQTFSISETTFFGIGT